MDNATITRALRYVADNFNDKGVECISPRKMERANWSAAPSDVREIARALNGDIFTKLGTMQTEGEFNDDFVTPRDLYAAARGTGYAGEDLSAKQAEVFALIRAKIPEHKANASVDGFLEGVTELRQRFIASGPDARPLYTYINRSGMERELDEGTFEEALERIQARHLPMQVQEQNGFRAFVLQRN